MFYVQQPLGVERSSPKAAHAGGSRRAQGAELWVDGEMPKKRENRIWWEYEWERQYHGKYEWEILKYSHISHFMDLWYFPLFSIIILGFYLSHILREIQRKDGDRWGSKMIPDEVFTMNCFDPQLGNFLQNNVCQVMKPLFLMVISCCIPI